MGSTATYPELRERLRKKILREERAGKPGEWNARKAQLLAREYKSAVAKKYGEGAEPYAKPKTPAQKSLDKWTREDWTTRDGRPAIRRDARGRATTARYMPRAAWERLTPAEARATDEKKRRASRAQQFVPNTARAKEEGRRARGENKTPTPTAKNKTTTNRETRESKPAARKPATPNRPRRST